MHVLVVVYIVRMISLNYTSVWGVYLGQTQFHDDRTSYITGGIFCSFSGNFDEFWSVNKRFMLNSRSEHEPFKSIPFCIYRVSGSA